MHLAYGLPEIRSRRSDYDIGLREYANATVYPADDFHIPKRGAVGVLDRHGEHIREAGLERSGAAVLVRPLALDRVEHIDEEVVFGGYISHHYGHFLLESLARLWAYRDSGLRVVWAAGRQFTPWEAEVFRILGIRQRRHMVLRKPTRFSRLWVPTPGYIIRRNFHTAQRDALAVTRPAPGSARVYLSRSSFKSRIFTVSGEAEVEKILESHGWRIVRPELLTIRDQIDIFATARTVAGIEGSALHTAMFCADLPARLVVLRREDTNANYDTIAGTAGLDQRSLRGQIITNPADDRFAALRDARECADRIIAEAEA